MRKVSAIFLGAPIQFDPSKGKCECGCGRALVGKQAKWANPECGKRATRGHIPRNDRIAAQRAASGRCKMCGQAKGTILGTLCRECDGINQ